MPTYMQLLNARDIVDELATVKLPGNVSLKLARSSLKLFGALAEMDKRRKELLDEFAAHDEDGKVIVVKEEDGTIVGPEWIDEESFRAEWQKLMDTDCGVSFTPIPLRRFPKAIQFTMMESLALEDADIIKE